MESQRWYNQLAKCKNSWVYFKLDRPVRGKVLSYAWGMCSFVPVSSNTIVLLSTGDTVRILELPCNIKDTLKTSDSVSVSPITKADSVGGIGDTKYDCTIKRTCYAHISKIK